MARNSFADALIDVAGIWYHEQTLHNEEKIDDYFFQSLYEYLPFFFLLKRHEPFISKEMVKADPSLKGYYQNYLLRFKNKRGPENDFFKHGSAFYDMVGSCVIGREDVTPDMFATLFALKLRQYQTSDEKLIYFLEFHYHRSFHNNAEEYRLFLNSLEVHSDLLQLSILQRVNVWATIVLKTDVDKVEDEGRSDWEAFKKIAGRVSSDIQDDQDTSMDNSVVLNNSDEHEDQASEDSAELPELPATRINGTFSQEEINHFFSFLHKERRGGEGSYLTPEQVQHILSDGISIPIRPLKEKYKLSHSPRYPKQTVDYFIYEFIRHYNVKEKRNILRFLGSYIEDYAKALDPASLISLAKNITGEKPKKLNFKLHDFLPERFY